MIQKEKIIYINGDKMNGVLYNWKKIFKEYNKLGCPEEVYNPTTVPITDCKWFIEFATRSTGKTTNWILLGMVMNAMYGTQIQYIRQRASMITKKDTEQLFSVIVQYGYIEKITNGRYNNVFYYGHKWRYSKTDENGNILEKEEAPLMVCLDIDDDEMYKSSYNAPMGDLIIVDEFVSSRYAPNEFVHLCSLIKTIGRDRLSFIIVMLANVTDLYSEYFSELCIQDIVSNMREGDHVQTITELGTRVYIEWIGIKNKERRSLFNSLFFGFKNPRLVAITGEGGSWAIDNYPHIERDKERVVCIKNRFIIYKGYLVHLEICRSNTLGLHVVAHKATKTREGDIIYTIDAIEDRQHRYKFGYTKTDVLLFGLYRRNKWYYANNEVGNVVNSYVKMAGQI